MSQLQFERWQQPQQKPINHFYKLHKQNVSCHKLDVIYLARDITKTVNEAPIVAVVFIRDISTQTENLHILRSLFVEPFYRNQGIATRLLKYLLQEHTLQAQSFQKSLTPLTVICEPELTNLYTNVGFKINASALLFNSPYLAKFAEQKKVILSKV